MQSNSEDARKIQIGDMVCCEFEGTTVVGTAKKFYTPTACEEQLMVDTTDGREFHAPVTHWRIAATGGFIKGKGHIVIIGHPHIMPDIIREAIIKQIVEAQVILPTIQPMKLPEVKRDYLYCDESTPFSRRQEKFLNQKFGRMRPYDKGR